MATPPQLTQFAFASGLVESQQQEVLDPLAGFPVLQNVRQEHRGGLSKRLGYGALSLIRGDLSSRTGGNRLFCHKDLVGTIDGTYLDTFASPPGVSVVASRVPEASLTPRSLTSAGDTLHDVVQCNGYVACATHHGTSVYVGVETVGGAVIRAPEVVHATAFSTSIALLGTYSTFMILLVTRAGDANIAAYYLNTASVVGLNAGWQSIGNVATDRSTGLSSQSLTDRVAFAYVNSSGGTSRVTVKTLTIAGVSQTATVNTSSTSPNAVGLEGSIADTLWIAWNEGSDVKMKGLSATALGTTLATTGVIFGASYNGATRSPPHIVSGSTPGTGKIAIVTSDATLFADFQTSAGATAVIGTPTVVFGVLVDARPFRMGERYYGLFRRMDASGSPSVSGESTNGISIMGDWTDATDAATAFIRPVGNAFPSLTNSITARALHPIVDTLTGTTAAYATPVRRSAEGISMELLTYDFADSKRWKSTVHNQSLCFAGGILSCFDGRRVAEVGFLHSPITPVATDTGGGVGPTGPVRYVATFEEVDADGNWTVSGVSNPSAPLTIADNTAQVVVFPLALSARISATVDPHVRVTLYRTLQGGEAPYFYVSDLTNDTSGYITFTDNTPDLVLATRRMLYGTGVLPGTAGASQDRRAPPFCQDVVSGNGMLVIASASDLLWAFQTIAGEGAAFNPAFSVPVDGDGDIVALAFQEGTFYAFKRRSVFAVAGEPPSDNGAAGGLGNPQRLSVDVGCINPNSVVCTSLGIFFQSERGIELLTRGPSLTWVGESIQDTLAAFPVVTSAVLDDRHGLVRFSLAEIDFQGRILGEGRDVVFDLALQAWQSVDDKTGSSEHEASQDACMLTVDGDRRYGWLGVDGTVHYERLENEAGAHLDGSTWVTMAAETAWLKLGGIQGKHHVNQILLLARQSTRADISMSLGYDYSPTYSAPIVRTDATIVSLSTALGRVQIAHQMHDEAEGQSVRLRIEDAPPTSGTIGRGKGATWIALTFEGTPRAGAIGVPEQAA